MYVVICVCVYQIMMYDNVNIPLMPPNRPLWDFFVFLYQFLFLQEPIKKKPHVTAKCVFAGKYFTFFFFNLGSNMCASEALNVKNRTSSAAAEESPSGLWRHLVSDCEHWRACFL